MNDKVDHLNSTVTPDSWNLPQQPVPTDKVDQLENPPSVPNPKLRLHSPVAISTSANDTRITDTHLRPSEDAPVISDVVSSQRALAFQELDNVGKQNWVDWSTTIMWKILGVRKQSKRRRNPHPNMFI